MIIMRWLSRLLVGIVVFFNLDCAIAFICQPRFYSKSFELSGVPGTVAVAGIGILFIMWNVPYVYAFLDPFRFRISLTEAAIMQGIGFVGESILHNNINSSYSTLKQSIFRFMIFDGAGLLLLLLALLFTYKSSTDFFRQGV